MSDDLIVIDKLVKEYAGVPALNGVSLRIRRGEFLSMLGPSGCGKTTLLRSIAGFVDPTSGDIHIDGARMNDVPSYRRPVNTVFQNYALFPHMTIRDNVAFGPLRAGKKKSQVYGRVGEILETVGMAGFEQRFPRQLSGGQQQRIALARAIINEPRVLLLDEPLGALDLKLRKRMQTELKRLHDKLGITFIYVTHDQEEALTMSDRIAVMNHGEIVQLGTGQEIYRDPVSRYVADFIGEANLISGIAISRGGVRVGETILSVDTTAQLDGNVSLMVRPPDIRIGMPDTQSSSAISLTGTLRDRVFAGHRWRLFVELPTGQEITVEPDLDHGMDSLAIGGDVRLWWPRDRCRVLAQ